VVVLKEPTAVVLILLVLISFGAYTSTKESILQDEKIYATSAAWLDYGVDGNPEHPMLVKYIFSRLMPENMKNDLRMVNADDLSHRYFFSYDTLYEKGILVNAITYLRIISGLLITGLLLLVFKLNYRFLLVFSLLYVSGGLFSALLDGWTYCLLLISYEGFIKNKPWAYATGFMFLPLTKIYAFVLAIWLATIKRKVPIGIIIIATSIIVCYGLANITFAFNHYLTSYKSGALVLRYSVPIVGLTLLRLFDINKGETYVERSG
jgi:hypothetical protein